MGTGKERDRERDRERDGRSAPSPSVLAAVDDPAVRDLLLEIAVEEGYGVYCASGALEALAIFGRERPGAVLVDLDMEDAKGLRFLNIFRQFERHEDVLCLAFTGRSGPVQVSPGVRVLRRTELARIADVLGQHFGA